MQFFQQVTRSCVGAVVNLRRTRQKNQFPLLKNATRSGARTFLSAATPERTKALRISLPRLPLHPAVDKNVCAPVTYFAMPSYPVLEATSPCEKGICHIPRHGCSADMTLRPLPLSIGRGDG